MNCCYALDDLPPAMLGYFKQNQKHFSEARVRQSEEEIHHMRSKHFISFYQISIFSFVNLLFDPMTFVGLHLL
ncbi:hypothetical protein EB796_021854 [Bugula neritina]|uniref:Uncharacterized protein n=1 Tax=Bugula neritina TaxID=10212 RepID=A0A7J7J157_BUGNE|nr:hypothetical protein EB796_021854 [Bugula neritina]